MMTDALLFAILVVIAIVIILTIERTYHCLTSPSQIERLTDEECGITGKVTLPYNALDRFYLKAGKDSGGFADLHRESAYPSDLASRNKYLAEKCDATPGCIAFNSYGYLKSGVRPDKGLNSQTYSTSPCTQSTCGLWVRKCSVPEPLYAELFPGINYTEESTYKRTLLPPGNYPDVRHLSGIVGGPFTSNKLSSLKIPRGLKVTIYQDSNYGGHYRTFSYGNYPDLRKYSDWKVLFVPVTWNDKMTSIKVAYDTK